MRHVRHAALLLLLLSVPARADGSEYVLQILELHEKLATNEIFQQQAKLLGAYMLEAQGMNEADRVRTYQTVLRILRLIEAAPASPAAPARKPAPEAPSDAKPVSRTPDGVLDAGAAQIEWFKAESLDAIPEVPVRKATWRRDLFSMGDDLDADLPPSPDAPVTARLTFFFEAKITGDHAFAAQHGDNHLRILVGGSPALDLKRGGDPSGRQVVHLEQGYHRIDVLLLYGKPGRPAFAVSVLAPGDVESRVLGKSDLLLRRSSSPAP